MTPSLIAIGACALLLAWNEYLYAFLLSSKDSDITLPIAATSWRPMIRRGSC
jgi:multiple sugar transport system permease protein